MPLEPAWTKWIHCQDMRHKRATATAAAAARRNDAQEKAARAAEARVEASRFSILRDVNVATLLAGDGDEDEQGGESDGNTEVEEDDIAVGVPQSAQSASAIGGGSGGGGSSIVSKQGRELEELLQAQNLWDLSR